MVWFKEFLPWWIVTAHCPLHSTACWFTLWTEGTQAYTEKGREEETLVFKGSILIHIEHGYTIIRFDTADNLVSCRSNTKSRHGEGSRGDRNFWNHHCHRIQSSRNWSITFVLQDYLMKRKVKWKSSCMPQQKIFLLLIDNRITKQEKDTWNWIHSIWF